MDTEQKLTLFEQRIRHESAATFPDAVFAVVERRRYRLKIRIGLNKETLIDIFYNPARPEVLRLSEGLLYSASLRPQFRVDKCRRQDIESA